MAEEWDLWAKFRIEDTSHNVFLIPITDTQKPITEIVQSGIIPFPTPETTLNFYGTFGDDILLENGDSETIRWAGADVGDLPITKNIRTFLTPVGLMNNIFSDNYTTILQFRAWRLIEVAGSYSVRLYIYIYHVATDFTETLLDSVSQILSNTETTYQKSITIDQLWSANERLKIYVTAFFSAPV